ncbi:MAG: hypothetical protein JXD23_05740 [Spirochaetales bacterium]|nr:hypothetical protein [Spirochaetales bacterium]
MEKSERKQVVYLDLTEIQKRERSRQSFPTVSDEELDSLGVQYATWLDLIDR